MSTKNLARTVIEGGRRNANRWRRRHSHRRYRVHERVALGRAARGADDEDFVVRRREHVRKDFHDKLSAAERWLERQVGRPWDLVLRDLLTRFDPRTTPGRHIVYDHMIPWVVPDGPPSTWDWFRVDRHGLLRRLSRRRHVWHQAPEPLPRPRPELEAWLAGRRVLEVGPALFWCTRTPRLAWRQEHRMDDEDAALWRSLPLHFRERHTPTAPTWREDS